MPEAKFSWENDTSIAPPADKKYSWEGEPPKEELSKLGQLKKDTLLGNMVTGAQESGIGIMQGARWLGEQLYGPSPHDPAEKAAYDASIQNLEKYHGSGIANWLARQAGDPLNYPLLELGGPKGMEMAAKGAKELATGAKAVKEGFQARSPEMLQKTMRDIEAESHKSYKEMRDLGVGVTPDASNQLVKFIDNSVKQTGIINPSLHKDYISVMRQMGNAAQKGLKLEELDQYRRLLRAAEMANIGKNPDAARVAREAIDALDEGIETMKNTGVSATGTKAIEALQRGRAQWAKARKFEAVSDVINNAKGDSHKMKMGFERLLKNPKKSRGFTKAEIDAMKKASTYTTPEKWLRFLGRFGFELGGDKTVPAAIAPMTELIMSGKAGIPSLYPLVIGGTGARYAGKLLERGKAEDVLRAIEDRQIPTPLPNVVKQLPHP